ncbi:MAG TPA: hypothetical protein VKE74_10360 [Gemmataceae bacterium]|nr:hypothetical protein [Gemmataceae bacterium]
MGYSDRLASDGWLLSAVPHPTCPDDSGLFEVAEKIPVPRLTRTCLFDPASGRLFVPVPRQEGKGGPELRVEQARPLRESTRRPPH